MAATVQRCALGEISVSRLQTIQSAKNRQNAVRDLLESPSAGKHGKTPFKPSNIQLAPPSKRPVAVFEDDHNSDEENMIPINVQSAKRAKRDHDSSDYQKPSLILVDKPATPMTAHAPSIKRKHTPELGQTATITPATAPVGREIKPLKHKRVGLLSNKRSSLSPYKRIDPPSKKFGGLPFSIDAAISGTVEAKPAVGKVPKLSKAMPNGWVFDIHEDTPDEEASIVMQHSCGILDLSSDDEEGPAMKKTKIGKENIAPADYVAAHVNANVSPRSRKTHVDAMTDEGDRSPLSNLLPEEYFANGLDKDSVAVVTDEAGEAGEQAEHAVDQSAEEHQVPKQDDFTFIADPLPASHAAKADAHKADCGFVIAEDADAAQL